MTQGIGNRRNSLVRSILIAGLLLAGCGEGDKPAAQATGGGEASADSSGAPKVGIPFVTREQYKPVVGKYGGRLVRATLGEPKTFNAITAGETSTTDYTDRMFWGLTREDAFTGEILPLIAESWSTSEDG